MAIWLPGYTKRDPLLTYYGSSGWHAHEMLFGYMVAVLSGFLLAAVRNWTNTRVLRGAPLAALASLWLAGRVLPLLSGIPPWAVAAVDLAFLPALALVLAVPLLRSGHRRKLWVILAPALLTIGNALVHSEWLGYTMDTARLGTVIAIYTLVLLITIVAGRLMPLFVERGSPGVRILSRPVIEYMSVITVIVLALADLFSPVVEAVTACAILAAVVHARRLRGWMVRPVLSQPLMWALLAGYAWLVAGFILLAVAYSGFFPYMEAFHALMVGGFGGMSLAMMALVVLYRTGRPLPAPRLVAMAFVMLNIAALVRIAGPLLSLRYAQAMISAAGALWIISFMLFLFTCGPVLFQARGDGRSGRMM